MIGMLRATDRPTGSIAFGDRVRAPEARGWTRVTC